MRIGLRFPPDRGVCEGGRMIVGDGSGGRDVDGGAPGAARAGPEGAGGGVRGGGGRGGAGGGPEGVGGGVRGGGGRGGAGGGRPAAEIEWSSREGKLSLRWTRLSCADLPGPYSPAGRDRAPPCARASPPGARFH